MGARVLINASWYEGFAVTAMLATTLIPTVLHAGAAIGLLALGGPFMLPTYRDLLDGEAPVGGVARLKVIFGGVFAIAVGVASVLLIGAVFYAAVAAGFEPFAEILADIAEWSGAAAEAWLSEL